MTKIEHQPADDGGRLVCETPHGPAELDYSLDAAGVMTILRTYVPPAARGRSIAQALVAKAVEIAKERSLKVEPECSYAARLFERHEAWRALRA